MASSKEDGAETGLESDLDPISFPEWEEKAVEEDKDAGAETVVEPEEAGAVERPAQKPAAAATRETPARVPRVLAFKEDAGCGMRQSAS